MNIMIKSYNDYTTEIANCQRVNDTKCNLCRRNSTCKAYNTVLNIDAEKGKLNLFAKLSKDEKIKMLNESKSSFLNNNKGKENESWVKDVIHQFNLWIWEIKNDFS